MGRKDKLRREKQARQRKKENAAPVATTATTTTTTTTTTAQPTPATATTGTWNDDMFPKSEFYVQAKQHNEENTSTFGESSTLLFRGATEYGCIHSMNKIGKLYTHPRFNGRKIHVGQPWFLEGSIRGSIYCVSRLHSNYFEAKPEPPQALVSYWMKMMSKYQEWSGNTNCIEAISARKLLFKDGVVKSCAICFKQDTETLTLRQCIGCSMYCYCSKTCQTIHWKEQNHGGECRQLKILNKYHKPYVKEIRKASIRGETHPALKKLRNKLGLTRPQEEYQQLCNTNTYEGKQIDPLEYIVARSDGSVWIGSTPSRLGLSSDTDTNTTATRATTTTPTARASSKDDEKSHKIK